LDRAPDEHDRRLGCLVAPVGEGLADIGVGRTVEDQPDGAGVAVSVKQDDTAAKEILVAQLRRGDQQPTRQDVRLHFTMIAQTRSGCSTPVRSVPFAPRPLSRAKSKARGIPRKCGIVTIVPWRVPKSVAVYASFFSPP